MTFVNSSGDLNKTELPNAFNKMRFMLIGKDTLIYGKICIFSFLWRVANEMIGRPTDLQHSFSIKTKQSETASQVPKQKYHKVHVLLLLKHRIIYSKHPLLHRLKAVCLTTLHLIKLQVFTIVKAFLNTQSCIL